MLQRPQRPQQAQQAQHVQLPLRSDRPQQAQRFQPSREMHAMTPMARHFTTVEMQSMSSMPRLSTQPLSSDPFDPFNDSGPLRSVRDPHRVLSSLSYSPPIHGYPSQFTAQPQGSGAIELYSSAAQVPAYSNRQYIGLAHAHSNLNSQSRAISFNQAPGYADIYSTPAQGRGAMETYSTPAAGYGHLPSSVSPAQIRVTSATRTLQPYDRRFVISNVPTSTEGTMVLELLQASI